MKKIRSILIEKIYNSIFKIILELFLNNLNKHKIKIKMAQSKKKLNIYNNKYRTALCKYHQANIKCPFESCCLYAHGPSQLLRLFKTPLKSTINSH